MQGAANFAVNIAGVYHPYGHVRPVTFSTNELAQGYPFDCSALTAWAYHSQGIDIGTYTDSQFWYCQNYGNLNYDINTPQVGDLMFLTDPSKMDMNLNVDSNGNPANGQPAIDHVVIIAAVHDDGTVDIVSASTDPTKMKVYDWQNQSLTQSNYWTNQFVAYGSPFSQNNYLAYLTALATYSDNIPPGEKAATESGMASVDAGADGYVNYITDPASNYENTGNNNDDPSPYDQNSDSIFGTSAADNSLDLTFNIGTIICTELHRQGLMASTIYRADAGFGAFLKQKCPLVLVGYHFWARPIVKHMRESKTFTRFIYRIAKPWAYEMAHLMGARKKGDLAGIVLMSVGLVVCFLIGAIITNVFWIDYLLLILIGVLILIKRQKFNKNKNSSKYKGI